MKIKTLRIIDLWVGRPICWLLTLAYKFKRLFIKKEHIKKPQKILFIKLFGIGSIVLSLPAIRAVKERYPDAQIYFLTFHGNEVVLKKTDAVSPQNIFTVRPSSLAVLAADVIKCLYILIRERIDVVIDLEFFSRFTAILSFAIRSEYRIGFYGFHTEGLKRGSFINYPINYNHTLHTSRVFFSLLKPLGIGQDDFNPELPEISPSPGYQDNLLNLIKKENPQCPATAIKKWVIINPNSSDLINLRKWPQQHFVTLTKALLDKSEDYGIIFIGGKDERANVESICTQFSDHKHSDKIVNLAGLTSFDTLTDLFHFSALLISNDSGPPHIAALTKIPMIILFGPETPELYSPLSDQAKCFYYGLDCQPCVTVYNGKNSYCNDNKCLQKIHPEQIMKAAEKFL